MVTHPPSWIVWFFYTDLVRFVEAIERAYYRAPFYATSWWRSEERNRKVGGHPYSQHLIGLAVDVKPGWGYDLGDVADELRQEGLYVVTGDGYIHAQLHPAGFLESLLSSATRR